MGKLLSQVRTSSPEFRENDRYHRGLVQELRDRLGEVKKGGVEKSVARHLGRGKLMARDRIERILDAGTAFLELSPLAAHGVYDFPVPSGGVVAGVGVIHGRECLLVANDATVKGGTYFPLSVKKHLRAQEVAMDNNLPCLYLVDSGGAFLPLQDEVFPEQGSLREDFLQPSSDERPGDCPDCGGVGTLHGWRCVYSCHE